MTTKETQAAYSKKWYDKRKARLAAEGISCVTTEERKIKNKAWREENKDRLREYTKQRRIEHKENFLAANAAYRKEYPARYLLSAIKSRCKKNGIPFNITEEDIDIPDTCPIFGFKLESSNTKGPHRASPSVDRIDPTKGYTKGNIQVISFFANTMKNDASEEELLLFAHWIINNGKYS